MSGNATALSSLSDTPSISTLGSDLRLTHSFWVASLTLTLYDMLLTLGDEITYIWCMKVTRTRVLFFLNRYWPIANLIIDNTFLQLKHPTEKLCFGFFNWFVYSPFVTHFTIGTILVLRIYAIYDRNRKILVILLLLLAGELVSETVVVGFIAVRLKKADLPSPFIGCNPQHIASWVWVYWLPMSAFESCLFLLAVAKAIRVTYTGEGSYAPTLLKVLLRDSVIYFGGVLSVIITNFIVWKVGRPSLFATFLSAAFAVHSTLGCRILINIQQTAREEELDETAMFTTFDTGPTLVSSRHKPEETRIEVISNDDP